MKNEFQTLCEFATWTVWEDLSKPPSLVWRGAQKKPPYCFGNFISLGSDPALCCAKACLGLFCYFLVSLYTVLPGDDAWYLSKKWATQSGANKKKKKLKKKMAWKMTTGWIWRLKVCRKLFFIFWAKVEQSQTLTFYLSSDFLFLLPPALEAAFPSALPLVKVNVHDSSKKAGKREYQQPIKHGLVVETTLPPLFIYTLTVLRKWGIINYNYPPHLIHVITWWRSSAVGLCKVTVHMFEP